MTVFIIEKLHIIIYCLVAIKPDFIFKMLQTKPKLHVSFTEYGYTIYIVPQVFLIDPAARSWKKQ